MALGGVATGSMKASEAAMVHGNMTYSGCISMAVACKKAQKTTMKNQISLAVSKSERIKRKQGEAEENRLV